MKRKKWSDIETRDLINMYPNHTDGDLIKNFPNRTLTSIKVKAKKLKLKKTDAAEFKNRSLAHMGEKNHMYGKKNELKGRSYDEFYGLEKSISIKNKISEYRKNNPRDISGDKNPMFNKKPYNYGIPQSDEMKALLSKKAIERYNNLSDEEKELRKQIWVKGVLLPLVSGKIKTKPEIIFETILNQLNIGYEPQKPIGFYVVDYCVDKFIFEVQGDYWHANPMFYKIENLSKTQKKNISRDKAKKKYLENKGFYVFYFWENDLIKNNDKCLNEIKKILHGII